MFVIFSVNVFNVVNMYTECEKIGVVGVVVAFVAGVLFVFVVNLFCVGEFKFVFKGDVGNDSDDSVMSVGVDVIKFKLIV